MSRSYKKSPVVRLGSKNGSEKFYKRLHSSKERRQVKNKLKKLDFDLLHFQQKKFDEWSTSRDGHTRLTDDIIEKYPELEKYLRK